MSGQTGGIDSRNEPPPADDDPDRRSQAVELNDDVVQGLVVARMAVEVGDLEKAAGSLVRQEHDR